MGDLKRIIHEDHGGPPPDGQQLLGPSSHGGGENAAMVRLSAKGFSLQVARRTLRSTLCWR